MSCGASVRDMRCLSLYQIAIYTSHDEEGSRTAETAAAAEDTKLIANSRHQLRLPTIMVAVETCCNALPARELLFSMRLSDVGKWKFG